jgi:hypothetical protein
MTTIDLIDFQDVEKDIMLFISRNPGKLCSIHHIFNDIIDDRDIKNPDTRKDLKTKINIVMSQLDSKQNNVTVIKKNNEYLVGYNIKTDDKTNTDISKLIINDMTNSTEETYSTENIAKTMFEYIIDNDINYSIKNDLISILFIGISLNDFERVEKFINKYSISLFQKNKDNKSILDLIPDSPMIKYCIKENNNEIRRLKDRENELLKNILNLNNELISINKDIIDIRKVNNNRNIVDMCYILSILFLIFYKTL